MNEEGGGTIFRKKTKELLTGDDGGSAGLVEKVRALETKVKYILWLVGVLLAAMIGSFFK